MQLTHSLTNDAICLSLLDCLLLLDLLNARRLFRSLPSKLEKTLLKCQLILNICKMLSRKYHVILTSCFSQILLIQH